MLQIHNFIPNHLFLLIMLNLLIKIISQVSISGKKVYNIKLSLYIFGTFQMDDKIKKSQEKLYKNETLLTEQNN